MSSPGSIVQDRKLPSLSVGGVKYGSTSRPASQKDNAIERNNTLVTSSIDAGKKEITSTGTTLAYLSPFIPVSKNNNRYPEESCHYDVPHTPEKEIKSIVEGAHAENVLHRA
jgi:hypothetical protein